MFFLPLDISIGVDYPLRADDRKRLETDLSGQFQTFRSGVALVFFGQSVLHQALIGPEFDCSEGSLEGRYLTLGTRRHAQNGALRNCVSDGLGFVGDMGSDFGGLDEVTRLDGDFE